MSNDSSFTLLKESYDKQYTSHDKVWRENSGKNKAENIISLCSRLSADKLLDIGSGDGSVLAYLDKQLFAPELFSIDISSSGIDEILKKEIPSLKEAKVFDGYSIPYSDKSFKLSTCSHVMEHVEHPRLLLREIGRVSEFQFFEIPIDFSFFVDQKITHFLEYGHINIFTPALFKFLLKSEGFEIVSEKFGFFPDETLKYSYKGKKLLLNRLKNFVVSNVPFLKKIKPNIYAVLCKKGEADLQIF